jgi:hypothetical protein
MRRPLLLIALSLLVAGLLVPAGAAPAQGTKEPDKKKSKAKNKNAPPGYKREQIRGFTLLVHDTVYENNTDEKWKRKPLDVLDLELAAISRNLPERTVKLLQRILIWIEWYDKSDPDLEKGVLAKYYGVMGNLALWSLGKNKHPLKANNVEVINMMALTREHQPGIKFERCVMLHELAHAVHHQAFGNNNAVIKTAYKQAMARGLYDEAKDVYGRVRKPTYASKNEREYFAELTCAYLDKLHYYPFTPEDLKKHDPVGYKVMEKCWGTRKQLDAARKTRLENEAKGLLAGAWKLYRSGKKKEGAESLAKLVEGFGQTKAGAEAKKLLEKWKEEAAAE